MTILSLRPSEIRYSQDSIAHYFGYGCYSGTPIGKTLDDLLQRKCNVQDIPTITVSFRDGLWYSGDNIRLWVFRKGEELGILDTVPVREGYINPDKFTTYNRGVSIRVRGSPGGRLWKQRNRKDLVIKEPDTSNPALSDSGFVVPSQLPEEENLSNSEEENLSNSELSDSSEDLTDIAYDSDQSAELEPPQSKGDTEDNDPCPRSCLSYDGQDNPTFVGDENDQQRMPGIKDQSRLDEITATTNIPAHSEYVSVDLSTLDEGPCAPDEPVVIDLQTNGSPMFGTKPSIISRSTGAVESKLGHKVPSLTTTSDKRGNCLYKHRRVWLISVIFCLVMGMLRLIV